jgi:hypothetical protein
MPPHASRLEVFLGAVRDECRDCRRRGGHFLEVVTHDLLNTRRATRNVGLCDAALYVYDRFDHKRWIREGSVTSDVARLVWCAYRTGTLDTLGEKIPHLQMLSARAVYATVPMFKCNPSRIRAGSVPNRRESVDSVAAALDGELAHDRAAYVTARLGGAPIECVYVAVPGNHTTFVELKGYPRRHPFSRSTRVVRADKESDMIVTDMVARVFFDEDREREYDCPLAIRAECVSAARVSREGGAVTYVDDA